MNANGSGQRRLTQAAPAACSPNTPAGQVGNIGAVKPTWSPDGAKIALRASSDYDDCTTGST